jgi:hypothetical protein
MSHIAFIPFHLENLTLLRPISATVLLAMLKPVNEHIYFASTKRQLNTKNLLVYTIYIFS